MGYQKMYGILCRAASAALFFFCRNDETLSLQRIFRMNQRTKKVGRQAAQSVKPEFSVSAGIGSSFAEVKGYK